MPFFRSRVFLGCVDDNFSKAVKSHTFAKGGYVLRRAFYPLPFRVKGVSGAKIRIFAAGKLRVR